MDLSFKQFINEKPTHFVEKILASLFMHMAPAEVAATKEHYFRKFKKPFPSLAERITLGIKPKLHSIRKDQRWNENKEIHFVINARTPDRYVFAPKKPVVSTQDVEINKGIYVKVDGRDLSVDEVEQLAINDGFEDVATFFDFFGKEVFKGKLIHWTPLRYEAVKEEMEETTTDA